MRYTVYKSLDNPSSLFGLQGSYIKYAAVGGGIAALVGVFVGSFAGEVAGIIAFVATAVAAIGTVFALQAKYSERMRQRWIASWKTKDFVTFHPCSIRSLAMTMRDKCEDGKEKTVNNNNDSFELS